MLTTMEFISVATLSFVLALVYIGWAAKYLSRTDIGLIFAFAITGLVTWRLLQWLEGR